MCMDSACMIYCVWDMNIYQFLYENHALAAEFCLLSVAILNLRIILTHRVKDILDHFSSLSVIYKFWQHFHCIAHHLYILITMMTIFCIIIPV